MQGSCSATLFSIRGKDAFQRGKQPRITDGASVPKPPSTSAVTSVYVFYTTEQKYWKQCVNRILVFGRFEYSLL